MLDYLPLFKKNFRNVEAVHSRDEHRHDKINAFKKREIQILLTTTILERGITYLNLCVAVIASDHQQFNAASLIQIAGRVDRKLTNQFGEIIFYHHKISYAMLACNYYIKKMNKLAEIQKRKV